MAKTTTVIISDDIDGSANAQSYTFAWQGVEYEIDLASKNLKAFEKALKPYIEAGTRTTKSAAQKRANSARRDLSAVRAWARDNGYQVSERGRVPKSIIDAYDSAS